MSRIRLLAVVLATMLCAAAGAQEQTLESLFPTDRVIVVEIEMDESDWDEIRKQSRDFVDSLHPRRQYEHIESPYTYVPARATIDGVTYDKVGVRKKGFFGSNDPARPSLKIKLDKYDKDVELGGLNNLTFNNNRQERSLMSQFMGYPLFNAVGIPAPRCAYAQVKVNGKNLGIYCHVETVRKPLLERGFGNSEGTLFEGTAVDFYPDWDMSFEHKIGDEDEGREMIRGIIDAVQSDDFPASLWAVIDEEDFYTFWAIEGLLGFWDGYSGNRNNFFVYANPETELAHFMPWGADCMFEFTSPLINEEGAPKSVRGGGLLAARLYRVPEARAKYAATMQRLLDTIWDEESLLAETERIEAMIEPYMNDTQREFVDFEDVRTFIRDRRAQIEAEIGGDDMPEWTFADPEIPVIPEEMAIRQAFTNAAAEGDLEYMAKAIDEGYDVNSMDMGGGGALSIAALANNVESIEFLIDRGAEIDKKSMQGDTPMMSAAFFGAADAVEALLSAGSDPSLRNGRGQSAYDGAVAEIDRQTSDMLGFIGMWLDIPVDIAAIREGRAKIVAMLEGLPGSEGVAAEDATLFDAAKTGDVEALAKHLDGDADPDARDTMGITVLCWATMCDQGEAVELLLERGADASAPNGDGGTSLHAAAFLGRADVAKLLVEAGADLEVKNAQGETPFDTASVPWGPEIAGMLTFIADFLELEVDPDEVREGRPKVAELLER